MKSWFEIDNVNTVDSPALIIFPDRVQQNISLLKQILPDLSRLRPHVKTHKSGDVTALLLDAGITKFKCATIAEAEMLAIAGAPDVLLAYQPVGPKAQRLLVLTDQFPETFFSCLVDNVDSAAWISEVFANEGRVINVYIDLNVGMNRTGIEPEKALALYTDCLNFTGIHVAGLHAYDGHLRDKDFDIRKEKCDAAFVAVQKLCDDIQGLNPGSFVIVAGGTPTFPIHAKRNDVECSPGTFIYWDYGYRDLLGEQPYEYAALVITRVISKPSANTLCLDLGHKSIASENPIQNRVHFLNAPDLEFVGHSEEHMTVRSADAELWNVGDVLYGVPFHVCPTCALYDSATIVEDHSAQRQWKILSRRKVITI